MTTQITVRLPDENVAWLDAEVAAGRFLSRTAGLTKLLTKAQRRQEDEADMLKILAIPDPDEESRLEWMRTREFPPMADDLSHAEAKPAEPDPAVRTPPRSAPKVATINPRRTSRAGAFAKPAAGGAFRKSARNTVGQ
ncbi:MAG: ribbon-helix-helix domain-containing protein [Nakamurella sp.]